MGFRTEVVLDSQMKVGHTAQLPIRREVSPLTEAIASVPVDDLQATYVSVLAAGLLAPDADFQPVVELLAFVARALARGSNWMMAFFMATSLNLP